MMKNAITDERQLDRNQRNLCEELKCMNLKGIIMLKRIINGFLGKRKFYGSVDLRNREITRGAYRTPNALEKISFEIKKGRKKKIKEYISRKAEFLEIEQEQIPNQKPKQQWRERGA